MDTSLLTIPTIVTTVTIAISRIGSDSIPVIASAIVTIAIARIGSDSIPVIASAIVTIVNDGHRPTIVSDQNDRRISQGALQYRFISCWFRFHGKKNLILEIFWTIKWTWLGDRSAIAEIDCFWTITAIVMIVTIKWTPGLTLKPGFHSDWEPLLPRFSQAHFGHLGFPLFTSYQNKGSPSRWWTASTD